MADCKYIGGCPFFNDNMAKMPTMASMYKKQFCQGDSTDCARRRVCDTKGRESVPPDLYPNDAKKADAILG